MASSAILGVKVLAERSVQGYLGFVEKRMEESREMTVGILRLSNLGRGSSVGQITQELCIFLVSSYIKNSQVQVR